ncbi:MULTISPECIES: sulfite exporter TauE/SafE family protein [unclassified Nocardioides]|uniref:sulfite exporter TauE/SafE family protein n=1 Tax=unclassified Nocardioides TaxID=2615069 RepID=UPI00361A8EF4
MTVALVAAVAVCGLAAAAQAVTGFGFALVAVPLLALVVGPVDAVVATTLAGLVLTTWSARAERRYVAVGPATRMLVGGVLGLPLGLVALDRLDADALHVLIAVTVGVLAVVRMLGLSAPAGPRAQWAAGGASGALLASTGMNGPPLVLVLDGSGLSPRRLRATLQAVFWSQDLVAVAAFTALGLVGGRVLVVAAAGALAVPLGWRLGDLVFARVPAERFRTVLLGSLVLAAAASLGSVLA